MLSGAKHLKVANETLRSTQSDIECLRAKRSAGSRVNDQ
jgi:hypothetical protein